MLSCHNYLVIPCTVFICPVMYNEEVLLILQGLHCMGRINARWQYSNWFPTFYDDSVGTSSTQIHTGEYDFLVATRFFLRVGAARKFFYKCMFTPFVMNFTENRRMFRIQYYVF